MNIASNISSAIFALPSPFELVPNTISNKIIIKIFNNVFFRAIEDGDLNFLENNWVLIEVTDIKLSFSLGLKSGRLVYNQQRQQTNLHISAESCDFLAMVTRKTDPDTLFFQRKIKMQGSTELGLYVKNFLDAFDVESHWVSLRTDQVLQKTYPVLSKILCKDG